MLKQSRRPAQLTELTLMSGAANGGHVPAVNSDNNGLAWYSDIFGTSVQAGVSTTLFGARWLFVAAVLPDYLPWFSPQPAILDG